MYLSDILSQIEFSRTKNEDLKVVSSTGGAVRARLRAAQSFKAPKTDSVCLFCILKTLTLFFH